ncbi:hypothetical protein [Janthinobacterium sp. B9-8]|nr:hypothetical protein [Janthinobacterium sp. B9-8]
MAGFLVLKRRSKAPEWAPSDSAVVNAGASEQAGILLAQLFGLWRVLLS